MPAQATPASPAPPASAHAARPRPAATAAALVRALRTRSRWLAGTILAEPSTKRGELVVAAMVALAVARWDTGRPAEALDLAAQAVRQATDRPYETTHFSPHMFLASALIQVRGLDEATAITDAFEVGGPRPEGITEVLRARIALAAGRLDDAVALAESASRRVEAGGRFAGDSLAVPVLSAVALRRAAAGRDREAIRSLEEALREYDRLRARRRVARTRRRLRQLGVRRRHWASEQRPAAGWASLTDTEQATARLVAEGLTNQRIADQMFISTHTVAFHLRQVFRKLDIRSRVDLARIALEHARPEAAQTP